MIPVKNLVSKKMIFFAVLLTLAVGAGLYFRFKTHKLSRELVNREVDLERSSREKAEAKNEYVKMQQEYARLQNDCDRAKKTFDSLTAERERLQAQVRGLLADRALARKLESNLDKANKDIEQQEKDRQQVLVDNLALKEQIKDLGIVQKQLINEKEQLSAQLAQERDKSVLKGIEQENAGLKQENTSLKRDNAYLKIVQDENSKLKDEVAVLKRESVRMKQSDLELSRLKAEGSTLREEVKKLNEKLSALNKDYAEAVKKNKLLEGKAVDVPKRFSEIARQNKVLIKRTADMHYNMGVFYTNQKEYARAAAEFAKAIELRPDDAYAHFNLGYIYAEHLSNRNKALEHFRQYLRFAKEGDKDVDWVKKYIVTWQAWEGKQPIH